jgi:murein DD-endopeptidase MepM/ murein hydrolase activator NlpD
MVYYGGGFVNRVPYRRVVSRGENTDVTPGEGAIVQCIVSAALLVIVLVVSLADLGFLRERLQRVLGGAVTVGELIESVRDVPVEEVFHAPEEEVPVVEVPEVELPPAVVEEPVAELQVFSAEEAWVSPASGRISSPSGMRTNPVTGRREFHDGIEIAVPVGTPILAPKDGEVVAVGFNSGYGNFLRMAHGNGYVTFFSHLSRAVAEVGDALAQGEQLAYSGNTGQSTGPHLHFSIFHDGQFVDPLTRVSP